MEWRDDRLFYFPLPENLFRTRARSIEDISQTSTLSNTDIVVVHPIHPFAFPLPPFPPSPPSTPSPTLLQLIRQPLAHNWKEAFPENVRRRGPPSVPCRRDRDHSGEIDIGFLSRCSRGSSLSLVIMQTEAELRIERGGERGKWMRRSLLLGALRPSGECTGCVHE